MNDSHETALVDTLASGVRVLALPMPRLETACVSVFVRSGSAHEGPRESGIGHVVEHMVFKGTAARDARRINLDAERLGAEVNAHTDKDHTAFHMRGLARDVPAFVAMLADLVLAPTFPEDELARERGVLLQEVAEDDDDPMSSAYKLFDRQCYGSHPLAQPVIGSRGNIQRFARADLAAWVAGHYTGANLVVGAAGPIDVEAFRRAAESAFGDVQRSTAQTVKPPAWQGGVATRRLAGSSQAHLVLGYPIAPLGDDDPTAVVAATVFGDGMSAPLMAALRERHGLAYYAACAADRFEFAGQFVIEASTSATQLEAALAETLALLRRHAEAIDAVDLERARNQIAVRRRRVQERAYRRLEEAALDLLALGRVRSAAEIGDRLLAVDAVALRAAFARMLAAPPALALAGVLPRGARDTAQTLLRGG